MQAPSHTSLLVMTQKHGGQVVCSLIYIHRETNLSFLTKLEMGCYQSRMDIVLAEVFFLLTLLIEHYTLLVASYKQIGQKYSQISSII